LEARSGTKNQYYFEKYGLLSFVASLAQPCSLDSVRFLFTAVLALGAWLNRCISYRLAAAAILASTPFLSLRAWRKTPEVPWAASTYSRARPSVASSRSIWLPKCPPQGSSR